MEWEEPIQRTDKPKPRDLQPLSIAELEAYIADMEAEILRARQMIAVKRKDRGSAEGLFRK